MLFASPEEFANAPRHAVTVFGMAGVGKTRLAALLRESHWFHYSVDYRIGTRHMGEFIVDNFKAELEQERFDAFGGDVYAKGFLKSYAVELGLDPQPLLDLYRRQVGHDDVRAAMLVTGVGKPPRQRNAPPAWIAWVLVAVVVVAVLGLVRGLGGGPTPDIASPDDFTEPPPAPAADDGDTDDDGDIAPEDPPETETTEDDAAGNEEEEEPEIEGVDLLLALEEPVWMRVIIDGSLVEERTVPAGETIQYTGDQEIQIRFGNAGGVRAQLNGEDLGAQGARGDVVDVVFTPDGSEIL